MRCPYCDKTFPLTWRRYWSSPTGRHTCPDCGKKSRLPLSVSYWALLVLAACVAGVPLAAIAYYWFGGLWVVAGWAIGGLLSAIPIDKTLLDERYRKLAKIERDDRAA